MKKELHLVIPGICGPLSDTSQLSGNSVVDHWLSILSKAEVVTSIDKNKFGNANSVISSLTELFTENDFPTGSLTLMANDAYEQAFYYMHADPVHLRADMDHAVLTSNEDLGISKDESVALLKALNKHFEQDGLRFIAIDENRWVISSKDKIKLTTTPLVDSIGRNVNFILPTGEDARSWRQILTEIQMLMFAHDVNLNREQSGKLSINSVWFHGCGNLDERNTDKVYKCCSDEDILKGIAKHINAEYLSKPELLSDYIDFLSAHDNTAENTVNILHISELENLVNYTDTTPWLNQLEKTLDLWVYPLIDFSIKNNISLKLYPCNLKQYNFSRYDSLKFWRGALKKDRLNQYIDSYSSNK